MATGISSKAPIAAYAKAVFPLDASSNTFCFPSLSDLIPSRIILNAGIARLI